MGEVVGVVGSGGREETIARYVARSDEVDGVVALPGNAGFDRFEGVRSVDVNIKDPRDISRAVREEGVNTVIFGPEAPLAIGAADVVEAEATADGRDVAILGTSKDATIEKSKIAQRELWTATGRFQPVWRPFEGEDQISAALEYLAESQIDDVVIKADGLAGGKGAILPADHEEAEETIMGMLSGEAFGAAGTKIIIEGRGKGPEVSSTTISDGSGNSLTLPYSQDYKRLLDSTQEGSDNPNTGGMGAFAPVPEGIFPEDFARYVEDEVDKALDYMAEHGRPVRGFWYEGQLLDEITSVPLPLEVNNRLGDPETQVILPVLDRAGVDIFELFRSAARGELSYTQADIPRIAANAAVTVCLAAEGYPNNPQSGMKINGLDREYGDDVMVHLAGISKEDGEYYSSGGRVIYVTGIARTIREARVKAYEAIGGNGVNFQGMQVRESIGDIEG